MTFKSLFKSLFNSTFIPLSSLGMQKIGFFQNFESESSLFVYFWNSEKEELECSNGNEELTLNEFEKYLGPFPLESEQSNMSFGKLNN